MKKVTSILSAAVMAIFLTSCSGDGVVDDSHTHDEGVENHEGNNHDENSNALQINDGQKWDVNPEMMVHVRNMESRLATFANDDSKDYALLAKDLKKNIGELTSSCTMTGKSHEELHKWLLPFIKTVDALKDAENDAAAAKEFTNIQTSMVTFNQYFK